MNVAAAERECLKLIADGRADSRTFELYSIVLGATGRHREAVVRAEDAHRLAPDSHSGIIQMSQAHFYANHPHAARDFVLRAIQMKPQSVMNFAMLGRIEAVLGHWDGVLEACENTAVLSNSSLLSQAMLAYAYAGIGDCSRAAELVHEVNLRRHDACYPAYEIAAAQALLDPRARRA